MKTANQFAQDWAKTACGYAGWMRKSELLILIVQIDAMRAAADLINTFEAHRLIGDQIAKLEKELK